MKKVLFLFLFLPFCSQAQVYLKPSIVQTNLPQNTDPICTIPVYTGNFDNTGLQAGDTCFDFTLYSLNGDTLSLSNELQAGKPILLINGNYTCPVFRNKVNMINQVVSTYTGLVEVFVIYSVEAHPTTVSPYFGYINTGQANTNAGILYAQPTTYLQRKNIVTDMLQNMTINAPVYIDGPCNEWWTTYGPAPNNAYLIKPNGIVFAKHPWFDKNPIDYILCDIDSLLYSTPCNPTTGSGNFILHQIDTLIQGIAGSTLYGYTELINPNNTPINIMAMKMQKNDPATWSTSLCADVCYPPSTDTAVFTIPANDTIHFSIDFFTDAIPDSGNIRLGFRNLNNPTNGQTIRVYAKTVSPNAVSNYKEPKNQIFPNPFTEQITLLGNWNYIQIFSSIGQQIILKSPVLFTPQKSVIAVDYLPRGYYFIGNSENGFYPIVKK